MLCDFCHSKNHISHTLQLSSFNHVQKILFLRHSSPANIGRKHLRTDIFPVSRNEAFDFF